MKTRLEQAAIELLALPANSRAMLAEKLLASLEDDEPSPDVERAWKREVVKRYKAFKAGKATPVRHEVIMREAYRMARSGR